MHKNEKNAIRGKGDQFAAALYGGRAMHGEKPPAIDRSAVLKEWRRVWRIVLRDLTPLQRRALELELGRAAG